MRRFCINFGSACSRFLLGPGTKDFSPEALRADPSLPPGTDDLTAGMAFVLAEAELNSGRGHLIRRLGRIALAIPKYSFLFLCCWLSMGILAAPPLLAWKLGLGADVMRAAGFAGVLLGLSAPFVMACRHEQRLKHRRIYHRARKILRRRPAQAPGAATFLGAFPAP